MRMPTRTPYRDCVDLLELAEPSRPRRPKEDSWKWVRENPGKAFERIAELEAQVEALAAQCTEMGWEESRRHAERTGGWQ